MKIFKLHKTAMNINDAIARLKLQGEDGEGQVNNPEMLFFLQKFENEVDWTQVKTQEELNQFVKNKLLPELKDKLSRDNKDSYYIKRSQVPKHIKSVSKSRDPNINTPLVQEWRANKQNGDKEVVEALEEKYWNEIISPKNNAKQKVFEEWWNFFMDKHKEKYQPVFIYSVMQPMIASFGPKKDSAPPSPDINTIETIKEFVEETGGKEIFTFKGQKSKWDEFRQRAMAKIGVEEEPANPNVSWKRIKGAQSIKYEEEYDDTYNAVYGNMSQEEISQLPSTELREKSRQFDELFQAKIKELSYQEKSQRKLKLAEEFDKSQEDLAVYGRRNLWCVGDLARTYNESYLKQGDFWILLENGEGKATIRFKDYNKMQEMRAYRNSVPAEYYKSILSFMKRKGWESNIISQGSGEKFYDILKKGPTINEGFENDPYKRAEIIEQARQGEYIITRDSKGKYEDVMLLDEDNRSQPEVQEAIKEGVLKQLNRLDVGHDGMYETPKSLWAADQITKEQLQDSEIKQAYLDSWIRNLRDHYNLLERAQKLQQIPKDVKKDSRYGDVVYGKIIDKISNGNIEEAINSLPQDWEQKDNLVVAIKDAIKDGYKSDPIKMEKSFMKSDFDIVNFFKKNNSFQEEIQEARFEAWGKKIKKTPSLYDDPVFPQDLKNNDEIKNYLRDGFANQIANGNTDKIPIRASELFPNDRIIQQAVKQNLMKKLSIEYSRARSPNGFVGSDLVIPDGLKDDEEILTIQKGHLISVFSKNPFETFGDSTETFLPEALRGDEDIGKARAEGVGFHTFREPQYYEENKDKIASFNLLEHPTVLRNTKKGWNKKLKENPEFAWDVPSLPDNHFIKKFMMGEGDSFWNHMRDSFIKYLESSSATGYLISEAFYENLRQLPQRILTDKKFIIAYRKALASLIKENPWVYTEPNFPSTFKNNKYIIKTLKESLASFFNKIPTTNLISISFAKRFNLLPEQVRNSEEIVGGFKQALLTLFSQEPDPYIISKSFNQYLASIPKEVVGDPDVFASYISAVGGLVAKYPHHYETLRSGLKNNQTILQGLQRAKNRLSEPYRASLQEGVNPQEIKQQIINDQRIPTFLKGQIINELVPQTQQPPPSQNEVQEQQEQEQEQQGEDVVANKSQWYKNAKTKKVIKIKSLKELI